MWSDDDSSEDNGISVEPEGVKEKFMWAAELGKVEVMKNIFDEDATAVSYKDDQAYTALHRAASEGQQEAVKFLLSHDADVSARTIDGWTPLHCACKWNEASTASLLLQNGSDINARSKGSATPLHAAAGEKNTREVLLLLLNDEDIDTSIQTTAGDTARDLAARYSSHSLLFDIAAPHINIF